MIERTLVPVESWKASERHGWQSPDVAARFAAGPRGEDYLESLPFGARVGRSRAGRELLAVLERTGLDDAAVLDFGCGNAVAAELLASSERTRAWSYTGVDVNALMIEDCRRRRPQQRFEVVSPGVPLPFPDASFDLVLASGVLAQVEDPSAALAEIARVSRRFACVTRVGVRTTRPTTIFSQAVRHAWGYEEHCLYCFNEDELHGMFARAGFAIAWQEASESEGLWELPDDPVPAPHMTYLLERR